MLSAPTGGTLVGTGLAAAGGVVGEAGTAVLGGWLVGAGVGEGGRPPGWPRSRPGSSMAAAAARAHSTSSPANPPPASSQGRRRRGGAAGAPGRGVGLGAAEAAFGGGRSRTVAGAAGA